MRVEEYVGQRIRDRRVELGLTQAEFGHRAGELLGKPWSRSTVSVAEKGGRAFAAVELVAIAHVLETRAARLITPPIDAKHIDLPGGTQLSTRDLVDFGVADRLLSDLYDDLVELRELLLHLQMTALAPMKTLAAISDKVETAIAAAEVATMYSDKTGEERS